MFHETAKSFRINLDLHCIVKAFLDCCLIYFSTSIWTYWNKIKTPFSSVFWSFNPRFFSYVGSLLLQKVFFLVLRTVYRIFLTIWKSLIIRKTYQTSVWAQEFEVCVNILLMTVSFPFHQLILLDLCVNDESMAFIKNTHYKTHGHRLKLQRTTNL